MKHESWKQNCMPVRSVTDLEDFSDLGALKEVFQNVRYVALGESTHGTREFFQLKHRILAFLVGEMGYNVFSIEAGSLSCQNINDYVLYGKGDRAKALASQGYWTWDTEEVTDLIEWMRQHNLKCQREALCQFIGYDIKPVKEAFDYIERLMPEKYFNQADLEKIHDLLYQDPLSDEEKNWLRDAILALHGFVSVHDQEIRAYCGQQGLNLLLHCTNMLWQVFAGMKLGSGELAGRDKFMAKNIIDMVNKLPAETKIVIWAHNAHIAVDEGWQNMGYWLRQAFGDLYYPAALTFTKGGFQSCLLERKEDNQYELGDLMEFKVGEPEEDFWENDLKTFSQGDFFLDFRSIRRLPSFKSWAYQQDKKMFAAGAGYYLPSEEVLEGPEVYIKAVLGKYFDGVFHIQETTRSIPTPTGMRIKG